MVTAATPGDGCWWRHRRRSGGSRVGDLRSLISLSDDRAGRAGFLSLFDATTKGTREIETLRTKPILAMAAIVLGDSFIYQGRPGRVNDLGVGKIKSLRTKPILATAAVVLENNFFYQDLFRLVGSLVVGDNGGCWGGRTGTETDITMRADILDVQSSGAAVARSTNLTRPVDPFGEHLPLMNSQGGEKPDYFDVATDVSTGEATDGMLLQAGIGQLAASRPSRGGLSPNETKEDKRETKDEVVLENQAYVREHQYHCLLGCHRYIGE